MSASCKGAFLYVSLFKRKYFAVKFTLKCWRRVAFKFFVSLFVTVVNCCYVMFVTVVMDKTDYFDKMDALVNDKQTYEELKRDPTPALQRKLNSKILTLKKTDAIDTQRYYRLWCSVPQPPKLYGLPFVSITNRSLVGTLITIGDVTVSIAIDVNFIAFGLPTKTTICMLKKLYNTFKIGKIALRFGHGQKILTASQLLHCFTLYCKDGRKK